MHKFKGYTSVGVVGLAAVVIFGLGWSLGTLVDPSWVFGKNMLSDLGADTSPAKYYFNLGCFFGGLLVMIAGIGIASIRKYRIYAMSGAMAAIAGVCLVMIGLFPTDTGNIHVAFAVTLFAVGTVGMVVMCAGDWKYGHVMYGGVTMVLLGIVFMTAMMESLEYLEAVAVIAFLIWFSLSCVKVSVIKEKM